MNPTLAATVKRLVALLGGAVVVFAALVARGDSVRLHEQAAVRGAQVTLADVAELEGPGAEALGGVVLSALREDQSSATVTIESVRRQLDEQGVNWADLSLCGYAVCRLTRLSGEAATDADSAAAVASNPQEEVNLSSTMTLRDLLVRKVEQVAAVSGTDLRITFDEREGAMLDRPVFGQRYEVVPHKGRGLGRLLLRVVRYEGERAVEQFTVTADAAKRVLAPVVVRTVGKGEPFLSGSFEVREVYLNDDAIQPIADPRQLVGQTAGRLLREGAVLTADDVRSAVLIRRGELVNVRCVSGNLVIRLDARAMEDGAMDEPIRLRNERSRSDFTAVVTGLREAAFTVSAGGDSSRAEASP